MRRTNFEPLGLVIDKVFRDLGLEKKMKEIQIKENWKHVVGPLFDKSTKKITIFNHTLFVSVDSAAIRNELMLNKTEIITKLNAIVNQQIIVDMVVR